jgi:hypothetical protein
MASEIHMNDIGTQFILTIKDQDGNIVDLSTCLSKSVIFQKPDLSSHTKAATFVTNGSDGKIYYTATSGDIEQDGFWRIQGRVEFATGIWSTNTTQFIVYPNN